MVKVFLNVSRDEQRLRLQERIESPEKACRGDQLVEIFCITRGNQDDGLAAVDFGQSRARSKASVPSEMSTSTTSGRTS